MSVVTILMSLITDIKSNADWQVKICSMDVVSLWHQLLNVLLARDMKCPIKGRPAEKYFKM